MAKTFYKIPDGIITESSSLVHVVWSLCSFEVDRLRTTYWRDFTRSTFYYRKRHFVDWIVLELLLCYHVKSRMLFFETLRNYLQWIPKPAHISIFNWRSITVHFPFIHHFYCIFISISKHRRITDDCMSIIKLFNTAHFAYNDRLPHWLHISPHRSF